MVHLQSDKNDCLQEIPGKFLTFKLFFFNNDDLCVLFHFGRRGGAYSNTTIYRVLTILSFILTSLYLMLRVFVVPFTPYIVSHD